MKSVNSDCLKSDDWLFQQLPLTGPDCKSGLKFEDSNCACQHIRESKSTVAQSDRKQSFDL